MVLEHKEEIYNIKKSNGAIIHAVYNYVDKNRPLIILSPPFEKDIRSMLFLMVYLINNNFNVFRYDNTYHNGNSTGKIMDWTLSNAMDDMTTIINFIKNEETISTDVGLSFVGMSLSSRVAFRYLAHNHDTFDSFLAIVGVVNIQYTLKSILGFDLVEEFIQKVGKQWGIRKVIHYPIDLDKYLSDCVGNNFHNLETTIEDINKIKTSMSMIVSEKDKWVDINDYHKSFENVSDILGHILKIPGAGHELYKNPRAAKSAFWGTIKIFTDFYYKKDLTDDEIMAPDISEIIKLNKREREREKKYEFCAGS